MKKQPRYPLYENEAGRIKSFTQKSLNEINLEKLNNANLIPDDLRISAEALLAQSIIAREAGYVALAMNLERAAELTRVPNDKLLKFYEALRPKRSSFQDLENLATILEDNYSASRCAAFIRECAEVYKIRGLLKD